MYDSNHNEVSVVIPLYNKEDVIEKVLISVMSLFPEKNIYIVDDCSTDNSLDVVKRVAPKANIFHLEKNHGKVRAIEKIIPEIRTKYTLLIDGDVILSDGFRCPTSLLENSSITATAFNVMPEGTPNKKDSIWLKFQKYEYLKSMMIGRKYMDKSLSVTCISGAAGMFKTERLIELTAYHSKSFVGEDLERTLIELCNDGKVIFVDNPVIETYAPETFATLMKQRVYGWWPGLWKNIPYFFKLAIKKDVNIQLRISMVYELFSLFTDPLKVFSLAILIYTQSWLALILLYSIYTILETIVLIRVRSGIKEDVRYPFSFVVLFTYFFYSIIQMLFRLGGLFRMIIHKKKLALAFMFFVMFFINQHNLNANGVLSVAYQLEYFNKKEINNSIIYIGYNPVNIELNTASEAPRYANVGVNLKVGKSVLSPSLLIKNNDVSYRIITETPIGNGFVIRPGVYYDSIINDTNFITGRIGGDYYFGDYNYTSIDVLSDFYKGNRVLMGNMYLKIAEKMGIKFGGNVNRKYDVGTNLILFYDKFFLGYSSYSDIDNDLSLRHKYLTTGLKLDF